MTTEIAEKTLETVVGTLVGAFRQLVRGTILHSDQLTTGRRDDIGLRNRWFYTADSAVYTIEEVNGIDEVFLYLGRGDTNPVFNNIEEATQQLITRRNYIPSREDVEAVKNADTTLRVKLSDLSLQENSSKNSKCRFFEIDTANYGSLNEHQRKVAERVYGSGEDFEQNMEMLRKNRIKTTRVYVLNPDYVRENVPQGGALARASSLGGFGHLSRFYAIASYVGNHDGLRGVRR